MDNEPKMHHYVPQFYLTGFTLSGEKDDNLWVFDKSSGNKFKSRPENIAKQKDYYKIDVNESDNNVVENMFAKIEGGSAPVINNIIKNNEIPQGEDFNILMYFLALLALRTPGFRQTVSNFTKDVAKGTAEMTFSSKERYESIINQMKEDGYELDNKISYEEMRDFIFSDRYDIEVDRTWLIYWIFEAIDIILPILHERNWSLIKIQDPTVASFICCDRPVSLTFFEDSKSFFGPGFGLDKTFLLMPINKRYMLMGTFEKPKKKYKADLKLIANFNSRLASGAERFIYSARGNFIYTKPDGMIGDSYYLMEQYRKKKN